MRAEAPHFPSRTSQKNILIGLAAYPDWQPIPRFDSEWDPYWEGQVNRVITGYGTKLGGYKALVSRIVDMIPRTDGRSELKTFYQLQVFGAENQIREINPDIYGEEIKLLYNQIESNRRTTKTKRTGPRIKASSSSVVREAGRVSRMGYSDGVVGYIARGYTFHQGLDEGSYLLSPDGDSQIAINEKTGGFYDFDS